GPLHGAVPGQLEPADPRHPRLPPAHVRHPTGAAHHHRDAPTGLVDRLGAPGWPRGLRAVLHLDRDAGPAVDVAGLAAVAGEVAAGVGPAVGAQEVDDGDLGALAAVAACGPAHGVASAHRDS